jgi:hypothetical protein
MPVHRKSSVSGPSKQADKQVTILQTATPVITVTAPSPVGVISSKSVSTAKAWDYARRATEFLEYLKNKEVDWEGNPFSLLLLHPSESFY